MRGDERALLGAVIENPYDDVVRLVYADWLEDHGDLDRSEFIRLQCQLARTPADAAEYAVLDRHAMELLRAHEEEWMPKLPQGVRVVRFRRGFLDGVSTTAGLFRRHAARLVKLAPIGQLYLRDCFGWLGRVASLPQFRQITSLTLTPWLRQSLGGDSADPPTDDGEVTALAASPNSGNLTELGVQNVGLGPAAAAALAAAPHLGRLACLWAGGNRIGDEGLGELAGSSNLPALTTLDLGGNGVHDGGAEALAGSALLGRLRVLVLSGNPLTARGVAALVGSPRFAGTEALELVARDVGPEGYVAVAQSPYAGGLRRLTLDLGGPLGMAAARAFVASATLKGLRRLRLPVRDDRVRRVLTDYFGEDVCRFPPR